MCRSLVPVGSSLSPQAKPGAIQAAIPVNLTVQPSTEPRTATMNALDLVNHSAHS